MKGTGSGDCRDCPDRAGCEHFCEAIRRRLPRWELRRMRTLSGCEHRIARALRAEVVMGETSRGREAVRGLAEPARLALEARYLLGKSYRELGAALGCSPDAARMRVARARAKVQGNLE